MTENNFIYSSDVPNDIVDIYSDPDINIKKLKEKNKNEFRVELEGKNIDTSIVNALRRTILMSIPIYAFHRSNIFIDVERSNHMYNNDFIYNQIETLPIFDIPNYFDLENPEIYLSNEVMKNLFGKFLPENYTSEEEEDNKKIIDTNKKLLKIEIVINIKNLTTSDKFLNTHDIVLKINDKISNSYKIRKPICILVLKPSEEISLRAEANLGISKIHASYESSTNVIFDEINPMKYHLWYETLEQLDKNLIFIKASTILYKKLENLKNFIQKKYINEKINNDVIEIELYGEEHTIGNLIATILQKSKYIEKAGYYMPHPFNDQIIISYKLSKKSDKNSIEILIDNINFLIKLFKKLEKISPKPEIIN